MNDKPPIDALRLPVRVGRLWILDFRLRRERYFDKAQYKSVERFWIYFIDKSGGLYHQRIIGHLLYKQTASNT
ncbi:MAG: hypothetical protein NHB32_01665 [Fischerella sp. CENA71]|nr:hypothetical protein [Fischerella sp. CENA71]